MGVIEPTAEHKWLAEAVGKWKAVGKMLRWRPARCR